MLEHLPSGIANTFSLMGLASALYRAHVREILTLIGKDRPLICSTDVQIMLALSNFTLKTPVHGSAACLYTRLFQKIFKYSVIEENEQEIEATETLYGDDADTLYRKMKSRKVVSA